jgi:epoxyqueuosine reductase QueG
MGITDKLISLLPEKGASLHNVITKLNINETICGICIAICPWRKRYIERSLP